MWGRWLLAFLIVLSTLLTGAEAWSRTGDATFAKLRSTGLTLVEPNTPEAQRAYAAVNGLLQRLVDPKVDGNREFRLVLVDNRHVNAGIVEGEGLAPNYVIINTGLLEMVKSDDELAHVISHELEHPRSQIDDYIESVKKSREQGGRLHDIYLKALGRVEENEVDIKALKRVIAAKYNPYAAETIFKRIGERYGEAGTSTHTSLLSRRNAIGSALTVATRGFGVELKHDKKLQTTIRDAVAGLVEGEKANLRRAQQIRELKGKATSAFLDTFRKMKLGKDTGSQDQYGRSELFSREYYARLKRYSEVTGDLVSREDRIQFQSETHSNLIEQRDRAFRELLGTKFIPAKASQMQELVSLLGESRTPPPFRAGESQHSVVLDLGWQVAEAEEKLKRIELRYASAKGDEQIEYRSQLEDQKRKIQALVEDLEFHVRRLPPTILGRPTKDVIQEGVREIVASRKDRRAGSDVSRKIDIEILRVMKGSNFADDLDQSKRLREFVQTWLNRAVLNFDKSEFDAFSSLLRFGDKEFWLKNSQALLDRVRSGAVNDLDQVSEPIERQLLIDRAFRMHGYFGKYWQEAADPNLIEDIQRKVVQQEVNFHRAIVARTKTLQEIRGMLPHPASEYGRGPQHNGFGVDPAHYDRFYDEKFARQFLRQADSIVRSELKQASSGQALIFSIDSYLKSLLHLRTSFPQLKGEIENDMRQAKELAVQAIQNRHFASENAAVGRLRAEAIFDAQYGQDLKEFIPIDAAKAKRHLNALSQISKRSELAGLISIGGVDEIASRAELSFGQKLSELKKLEPLIGRNSSVRFLSPTEVTSAGQLAMRLSRDPEGLRLAAKTSQFDNVYEYPDDQKKLLKALGNRVRHEVYSTLWTQESYKAGAGSGRGAIPDADGHTRILNRVLDIWGAETLTSDFLDMNESETLKTVVSSVDESLDVSTALVDVTRQRLRSGGRHSGIPLTDRRMIEEFQGRRLAEKIERRVDWLLEKGFGFQPSDADVRAFVNEIPIAKITNFLSKTAEYSTGSKIRDIMLERVFEVAKSDPKVLHSLRNPKLVQSFRFKENRERIAQWQLEDALSLDERARVARASRAPVSEKESVRNIVQRAKRLIDLQYPSLSGEKSAAVERLEQKLLTTVAESRYLKESRLNSNNWMQVRELAGLDVPSLVASYGRNSAIARLEMMEYLIGDRSEYPTFLNEILEMRPHTAEEIQAAKKYFLSSDVASRSFALQSMMDEASGVFSDPALTERVYQRILGENASNPVIREVFTSYLDDLPPSERNVIISYIYATFADRREGSGRAPATLKTVFEAMGPMGIKAGQFLRSSGRLSKEQAQDLDHFFSNALPPTRPMIYDDLAKATGAGLDGIAGVREMVGSGSINYGVRVTTEQGADAVARFRKPHVEGQIANENQRWERVIAKLSKSTNAEVRRLSSFLEEAREAAVSTLGKDGVELDLSHERRMYELAKKAYDTPADKATGFRIEAVRPIADLQSKVPEDQQKLVSFYEYIESENFKNLPQDQQQKLARQILGAELEAIFRKGAFDPDGHVGNWMVDVKSKRLVRIDYAQLRAISPREAAKIGEVVNLLFLPKPNASDVSRIAEGLGSVLEIPAGYKPDQKTMRQLIATALVSEDAPSGMEPHLRLLHLRDALERQIEKRTGDVVALKLKPNASAVMSSIGRIMYYRDIIPEKEFAQALKTHMGTPIERVFVQTPGATKLSPAAAKAADKILQVADRAKQIGRSLLTEFNCAKEFLRLKTK